MEGPERVMSPPLTSSLLSNVARTSSRSGVSPLRQRPISGGSYRSSTFGDTTPISAASAFKYRRSSTFSESAASLRSSTDDLLLPRAKSPEEVSHHDHSHWHSVPLVLALLPAAGGLFFEGGGAVLTDLTLLTLAAVFLNWSVRLPWDWYFTAQAVQVVRDTDTAIYDDDTIAEEGEEEEGGSRRGDNNFDETASQASRAASPKIGTRDQSATANVSRPAVTSSDAAVKELRAHELLALITCFVSPLVGAWLLHHIRAQLSRPSEGLVSNYNLTIFLLAAELRPLSHLIKLVQARTLHLQRTVAINPHLAAGNDSTITTNLNRDTITALTSRLTTLEAQLFPPSSPNGSAGTSSGSSSKFPALNPQHLQTQQDLIHATRRTLAPDLEALNRAVRRYEKRTTVQTMQTESRLQELESKLADAITLAAAAQRTSHHNTADTRSSNHRRRSIAGGIMNEIFWSLPLRVMSSILRAPLMMASLAISAGEWAFGREMRTAGFVAASHGQPRPVKGAVRNGGTKSSGSGGGSGGEKTRRRKAEP